MRLTLALSACLAAPLAAETRQQGNVIFDISERWVLGGSRDDGRMILRSDLPNDECDYCRIFITPGDRASARAGAWVGTQTRRFIDADDTLTITPLVKPEITNFKDRPAAMLGQKADSNLQILFAVQLFGRMQLIAFEASAYDVADLAEGMTVFQRDVAPLVESARFVREGAKPLLPDPAPALDRGDTSWGNYRVAGDRLTLTYASGETADLTQAGESLVRGEATLYPVEPLPDGTKVDGSFPTFFYSGFTSGRAPEGEVSASNYSVFNPDGSWSHPASCGASASFVDGAGATAGGVATDSEKGPRRDL